MYLLFDKAKVHDGIARVDGKIDAITDCLSTEPCVVGSAAFNSYDESHNSTCLPGTRVELARQILHWAGSENGKPIFWLNGMLGTGKSTVSRTVAKSLHQAGRLGASFFFKRGHSDRQNAAKFFTTIADQLARMQPAMADPIKNAARADSSIGGKGVEEQFSQLILQPRSTLPKEDWKGKQVVIVVDALDECWQQNDAADVLRLLSTAEPWLRVFVTSRPELPIRLGFIDIKGEFEHELCHAIPHSVVKQDIRILFKHRLGEIRDRFNKSVQDDPERLLDKDWPGEEHINTLAEMATPLLIYASMLCSIIDERRCEDPDIQLDSILAPKATSSETSPETKLDEAYLFILNQLIIGVSSEQQDRILREFHRIVGSIVLLGSPLSTSVLSELLGIPSRAINSKLDMLHSVLDIQPSKESPVRILHVSFRDFLVRETKEKHAFWIDEAKTHEAIAARCLHVITQYCEPEAQPSGREVSMADRNGGGAKREIQYAAVQYACLHWVFHLQRAEANGPGSSRAALSFLKEHFLHWLEVLSEMRQVPESIKMLEALRTLPHVISTTIIRRHAELLSQR